MTASEALETRLEELSGRIASCRICRDQPTQKHPLPHEPRPVVVLSQTARILIAGQAPGLKVHESGLPFNDASGDRLRFWLGVNRETFYNPDNFAIAPMGFCFPGYDSKGSDLPPRKECASLWRQEVIDAMPQIELVLAVGSYAQKWHLPNGAKSMTETVSNWNALRGRNESPVILPLPHPSWRNTGWLKRNPWFEQDVLPELRLWVENRIS